MGALWLFMLILATACTGHYKPFTQSEQAEYDKASRNIYPDDVRLDPTKYSDTLVVWPGIIVETSLEESSEQLLVTFVLEHHYFDWLDDSSIQKERYFFSARGEGQFQLTWTFKPDSNRENFRRWTAPGVLLIVYGKPHVDGSDIKLTASHISPIEKKYYRSDWDYGRAEK